jgi:hypothetical protein
MDPDPGGPKTCGSGFGSGSATLVGTIKSLHAVPENTVLKEMKVIFFPII